MIFSAHLHTHSLHTKGNSTLELEALVKRSKEFGMSHVALVDSGNVDGFGEFENLCSQYQVKPIFGCGFYHTSGCDGKRNHLVLLAKNCIGLKNLKELVRLSFEENFYDQKPHITDAWLESFSEGLICLTGGLGGELDKLINSKSNDLAKMRAQFYQQIFGDDFYLELQNHGFEKNKTAIQGLVHLSKALKIELVVTQGAFYLDAKDAASCNTLRENSGNKPLLGSEFYYKSPQEMECLFSAFPKAMINISSIVKKINYIA